MPGSISDNKITNMNLHNKFPYNKIDKLQVKLLLVPGNFGNYNTKMI